MTPDTGEEPARGIVSEETVDTPASPAMNLAAAALIGAIAVLAIVLAARMPNPGTLASHPGLLPMLTGVSLLVMAIGLGAGAIRDGAIARRTATAAPPAPSDGEARRTVVLMVLITGYVVLLAWLSFEARLPAGPLALRIGSFECVSVPVLALILRLFWRARWRACLAVAAAVVLGFAAVFRYGFVTLLPGS